MAGGRVCPYLTFSRTPELRAHMNWDVRKMSVHTQISEQFQAKVLSYTTSFQTRLRRTCAGKTSVVHNSNHTSEELYYNRKSITFSYLQKLSDTTFSCEYHCTTIYLHCSVSSLFFRIPWHSLISDISVVCELKKKVKCDSSQAS